MIGDDERELNSSTYQHSFVCPKCKISLIVNNGDYFCPNCEKMYGNRDGYVDFTSDFQSYDVDIKQENISQVLNNVDNLGFEKGLFRSFDAYPSLEDRINDVSGADLLYHCIGENNLRCLDIGSDLGNLSETLSYHYQQVYSVEFVAEKIKFQNRRYQYSRRSNITILRANLLELPFPENYFDLIVCNNIESINSLISVKEAGNVHVSFLGEMKRVLSPRGCLCLGIENRFGIWRSLASNLAMKMANFAIRKDRHDMYTITGRAIRDPGEVKLNRYHISHLNYPSLINEAGFKTKTFWVYPHHTKPTFSANIADRTCVKGFIRHSREKIAQTRWLRLILTLAEALDNSTLSVIARATTPSFFFYCYKNEIRESIEDTVIRNTGFESYVLVSGSYGILYLLFDEAARPVMVLHQRRYGFNPIRAARFSVNSIPERKDHDSNYLLENWLHGRRLNPLKFEESQMAFQWLIVFQSKRTPQEAMTERDVSSEADYMRDGLSRLPQFDTVDNHRWINDYENYMKAIDVRKAPEHGDFWRGNILIELKSDKINVIDWEHFREKGNPFFDFTFFILTSMQMPSFSDFGANLQGSGSFSPILRSLQTLMDDHFGFKANLNILLAYAELRYVLRRAEEQRHDRRNISYYAEFKKHCSLLKTLTAKS